MGATYATVLRKSNAAMRIKVTCLNLIDCGLYKPAKFLTPFFGDRRPQILDLGSMLPHENHECYFWNSTDPRVTDELRIKRKQTVRALWVATRCGLPVDQAVRTVDVTYRVEIRNKLAATRETPKHFDLYILFWITNANTIILDECLEQMDSLMDETVPGLSLFVFERSLAVSLPFLEQHRAAILFAEVSSQSVLKTAAKSHSRASFFFPPAIEVAVTIAARAAEVLADLRVAIDHRNLPARRPVHRLHRLICKRALPTR